MPETVAPCPLCGDTATPRLYFRQGEPNTPGGYRHVNCNVCGAHWTEPWVTPEVTCGTCGAETPRLTARAPAEGWAPEGGWQRGDIPVVVLGECAGCAAEAKRAALEARQRNPQILERVRLGEAAMLVELGGRTAAAA